MYLLKFNLPSIWTLKSFTNEVHFMISFYCLPTQDVVATHDLFVEILDTKNAKD